MVESLRFRTGPVLARLGLMALTALTALAADGCAAPERPARPPDVLVVVLDAVRADHLGFGGALRPTSPVLDRLASESVRFENAFAAATWTKPSIASLFTSRYPSEHGLLDLDVTRGGGLAALDRNLPVVAESFRTGGWATLAVVNQVQLTTRNGFARGFEQFVRLRNKRADFLNRTFETVLDEIGTRPFFAYIHYLDAHWPYDPVPGALADQFGTGDFAVPPPDDPRDLPRWQAEHLDAAAIGALESRYDAEIRGLDSRLGDLFDLLRRRGRWDETILVVTSDHGESFAERGQLQHGLDPYVEQARVPLLVRLPARFGFAPGPRRSAVGHVDLAPTLLDLAGAPPLPGARGRSLRALLAGREAPARTALTQAEGGWALRDPSVACLAFADGRAEWFDRARDPAERRPLGPSGCAGRCLEIRSQLLRLRAELRLAVRIVPRRPLSADEAEKLRALGYL